jgi:putative ABC transport system substrate-binding protein
MRRRRFIAGLSTAAIWPLLAHAQQTAKVPRLGFIGSSTASAMSSWIAAFIKRLGELGWIENNTVTINYQFAEGRNERMRR